MNTNEIVELLYNLERLTNAVEKIVKELQIQNSYQVTCSDNYTHIASFSYDGDGETK